jgi:hypothetical protein
MRPVDVALAAPAPAPEEAARSAKPLWMRAVTLLTAAALALQGCGSGIGTDEGSESLVKNDPMPAVDPDAPLNAALLLAALGSAETGQDVLRPPLPSEDGKAFEAEIDVGEGSATVQVALEEKGSQVVDTGQFFFGRPVFLCNIVYPIRLSSSHPSVVWGHQRISRVMQAQGNVIRTDSWRASMARYTPGTVPSTAMTHNHLELQGTRVQGGVVTLDFKHTVSRRFHGTRADVDRLCKDPANDLFAVASNWAGLSDHLAFWLSTVVTAVFAGAAMIVVLASIAAFPEGSLLTGVKGPWDIGMCFGGFAGVIAYNMLARSGSFGWMTWVEAVAGCLAAIAPARMFRGAWAGTYAPWMVGWSNWVRKAFLGIWGMPAWAADSFGDLLLKAVDYFWLFDRGLPVPPVVPPPIVIRPPPPGVVVQ